MDQARDHLLHIQRQYHSQLRRLLIGQCLEVGWVPDDQFYDSTAFNGLFVSIFGPDFRPRIRSRPSCTGTDQYLFIERQGSDPRPLLIEDLKCWLTRDDIYDRLSSEDIVTFHQILDKV